ncbi:hypothetical protein MAR_036948, partial [Mya arenaria]
MADRIRVSKVIPLPAVPEGGMGGDDIQYLAVSGANSQNGERSENPADRQVLERNEETKLKCNQFCKKLDEETFGYPELRNPAKELSECQNESLEMLLRHCRFAEHKTDKQFSLVEFCNFDKNTMVSTIANDISSIIDFGSRLVCLYSKFGDDKEVFLILKAMAS